MQRRGVCIIGERRTSRAIIKMSTNRAAVAEEDEEERPAIGDVTRCENREFRLGRRHSVTNHDEALFLLSLNLAADVDHRRSPFRWERSVRRSLVARNDRAHPITFHSRVRRCFDHCSIIVGDQTSEKYSSFLSHSVDTKFACSYSTK